MRIGTQLSQNQQMQAYLRKNGFVNAVPKFIENGSQRGCWRIYSKTRGGGLEAYDIWTDEARQKLSEMGFVGFDGEELSRFSGNGGLFSVFVRYKPIQKAKENETA